jgi:RNA polymerase sigma factor (sigma-70 family)
LTVDDRSLQAALAACDPHGLEAAYRAYADQLYTYCRGMLADPAAAADAVHDTFVLATSRAGELTESQRLRGWLYAIARNECLRRSRDPDRATVLPVTAITGIPTDEPVSTLPSTEIHELVVTAAGGMEPLMWQLFELVGRHRLPAYETGVILGLPVAQVPVRLARALGQLERAVGALLVAQAGRRDCPRLAETLRQWGGRFTPAIQEQAIRHLDSCPPCAEGRWRRLPPSLVAAYRAAPWLPVPAMLWPRLKLHCFDPGLASERDAVVRRAERFDPATGFPQPLPVHRRRRVAPVAVAAAAAALLAAGTGALALAGDEPAPAPVTAPTAPPAPLPTGPATGGETPTPSTTPTRSVRSQVARGATPLVAPLPSEPTATPGPTAGPRPLTLEASVEADCFWNGWFGYRLVVTAVGDQPLDAAELFVVTESGARSYPMQIEGEVASVRTSLHEGTAEWWVEATSADEQPAATGPVRGNPCDD